MGEGGSLQGRSKLLRLYAPATLLLATGLLSTYRGYREAVRYEQLALQLAFENAADKTAGVLDDVSSRELNLTKAALALFRSSQDVTRSEFATFAKSILPGSDLSAIEWAPYVPYSKRAAFESTLGSASGFTQWSDSGTPVPAEARDDYFPVYYIEPVAGNERLLGFDLGSEPIRRNALIEARDSGELAVAGPIRSVQEPTGPLVYLLVLPHYRTLASNVPSRRKELEGFAAVARAPLRARA